MIKYDTSIIIPIYNVEKFLDDCIKSCLAQNNTEIILVDDGSTDKSSDICMNYVSYPNIKYVKQVNKGLSEARNRGIVEASGEYILFVDSDDMIIPGTVKNLLGIARSEDSDVVLFNYRTVSEIIKAKEITNNYLNFNEKLLCKVNLSAKSALEILFKGEIQNYSWSMLVKKKIYIDNDISFPVNRTYEDIATTYLVIGNASVITRLKNYKCYLYRQREGSITKTPSIKMAKDLVVTLHEIDKYLDTTYAELKNNEYINFVIPLLLLGYSNIYDTNSTMSTKKMEGTKIKLEILKRVKSSYIKKMKAKNKVAYVLLRMGIFIPIQRLRKMVS